VDAADGFRHFEAERVGSRARTRQIIDAAREPRVVPDLAALESPGEVLSDLLAAGLRSALILPLTSRRKPVGALVLSSQEPGALTASHLQLLKDLERPLASAVEKARLFREAAELSRQMTALYDVGQALNSPLDTAGVTERVLSILHETFRFQHSAVLTLERYDDDGEWLVMQASRGYSLREEGAFRMKVGERGVTSRAVRTGRLVYVPDVRRDPDYVQGVERGRSEVAIPLLVGGRVVGVLDVESTRVDAFSAEDLETLKLFSTQVALALARARTFEEIRKQAMTDSLTGLLNQRYFKEKVEREIDRSRQTGRPFVLALFDVDDFKTIND
jgi:GAF domain-containing protein